MGISGTGLQRLLAFAGLLPFLLALGLQLTGTSVSGLRGSALFITYGAVILSFLAGALWGRGLFAPSQTCPRLLMVASNLLALLAWLALLMQIDVLALAILASGFVTVFAVEWKYSDASDRNYLNLRLQLTIVVVMLHLLFLPMV